MSSKITRRDTLRLSGAAAALATGATALNARPARAQTMDHGGHGGMHHGGATPAPTIEAVEGDRVRIYVTNGLPAPTSVHWHGMLVPSGMDGVGGLSQRAI